MSSAPSPAVRGAALCLLLGAGACRVSPAAESRATSTPLALAAAAPTGATSTRRATAAARARARVNSELDADLDAGAACDAAHDGCDQPAPFELRVGTRAVRSESGAVTSVEAHATRAGVEVLSQGGNAVDAAVAVAYALAVTHPSAGNLGGGGFMLVRPRGGPTVAVDFREVAPRALTRERFDAMIRAGAQGSAAVGVPGTVAGLELAREKYGRLPRSAVMAPAIALGRGFELGARQALLLAASFGALGHDRAARAIFGDGARPKPAGARLVQSDLVRTLERIRDRGPAGFYTGETAQALASLDGGLISLDDLAAYTAKIREALRFDYRGFTIEVMPPPSAGGVVVAETLAMLRTLEPRALVPHSAEQLHFFLEASRRAQIDRRFAVMDPDALTPALLAERTRRFLNGQRWLEQAPIDPAHATASTALRPELAQPSHEAEHTTHFGVVDAEGMVVSCTVTLSASFGAKIVAPGTGVVLNNSVASFSVNGDNLPLGGRRTVSSMAPTLVLSGSDPVLVLGSPGGDTIPSTIVAILEHLIDHRETLEAAIDAGRMHQGLWPDEARYEAARPVPTEVLNGLKRLGHRLRAVRAAIGDANAILIRDGVAWAYADPREPGLALSAPLTARTR